MQASANAYFVKKCLFSHTFMLKYARAKNYFLNNILISLESKGEGKKEKERVKDRGER